MSMKSKDKVLLKKILDEIDVIESVITQTDISLLISSKFSW